MTKSINKRLLILLAALVLVCGGMAALNGTFAAQVDTSGSATELIGKAFQADLQYWNGAEYVSLLNGTSQPFTEASKWCPGRSEIVYLKLISNESFPINSTLSLEVDESGFDDTISFAVLPQDLLTDTTAHPTSWAAFASAANGAAVLAEGVHELMKVEPLMPGEEQAQYLALCMHMDESASSEYQNKQLSMKFTLRLDAEYEPGYDPNK